MHVFLNCVPRLLCCHMSGSCYRLADINRACPKKTLNIFLLEKEGRKKMASRRCWVLCCELVTFGFEMNIVCSGRT